MRVRLRSKEIAGRKNVLGWLRFGEDYTVLAIESLSTGEVGYRIATEQGTPALFETNLFAVTDPQVNGDWEVRYCETGTFELVPERWSVPGFWEDFFNGTPDAVSRYQEVLRSSKDARKAERNAD